MGRNGVRWKRGRDTTLAETDDQVELRTNAALLFQKRCVWVVHTVVQVWLLEIWSHWDPVFKICVSRLLLPSKKLPSGRRKDFLQIYPAEYRLQYP